MTYTDEQIQEVCDLGYKIMGKFTYVQYCLFPSDAIINAMKAGKTAQEVADAAYHSIASLPLQHTRFGLVGMGDTMRNIATYMADAVRLKIEEFNEGGSDVS